MPITTRMVSLLCHMLNSRIFIRERATCHACEGILYMCINSKYDQIQRMHSAGIYVIESIETHNVRTQTQLAFA